MGDTVIVELCTAPLPRLYSLAHLRKEVRRAGKEVFNPNNNIVTIILNKPGNLRALNNAGADGSDSSAFGFPFGRDASFSPDG